MKMLTLTTLSVVFGSLALAQPAPTTATTKTQTPNTITNTTTNPATPPADVYVPHVQAGPAANSTNTGTGTVPGTTGALTNTNITTKIRQDLMSDPRISNIATGITVENLNGQIVLRGQVPSRRDEEDILSRVKTSSGSSNIDNQLKIAPTQNSF